MPNHEILTSEAHRNLRIRTDRAAHLGDSLMSCPTFPAEFRQVQNEYAILFRRDLEHGTLTALAMFGFQNGENLYLQEGRWDARYIPLVMDIQPFLIGTVDGHGEKQIHIDMESPRISRNDEGVRVFDDLGRASPFLEAAADKLGALNEAYQGAEDFFNALQRHDLLEPMTLEVTLTDGSTNRLVGFHVIAEERLRSLEPASLADLHRDDHLMAIFMALASLGNLSALIARKDHTIGNG